jgi:hypothetical protein
MSSTGESPWTSRGYRLVQALALVGVLLALAGSMAHGPSPTRARTRVAAEEALPEEAARLLVVSGSVTGNDYTGTNTLQLSIRNPTSWEVTEIALGISTPTKDGWEESRRYLPIGTLGPGAQASLSITLAEVGAWGRPPRWRYLGARGVRASR